MSRAGHPFDERTASSWKAVVSSCTSTRSCRRKVVHMSSLPRIADYGSDCARSYATIRSPSHITAAGSRRDRQVCAWQTDAVRLSAVVGHQPPACETLFEMVKTKAHRGMRLLRRQHVEVAIDQTPWCETTLQFARNTMAPVCNAGPRAAPARIDATPPRPAPATRRASLHRRSNPVPVACTGPRCSAER